MYGDKQERGVHMEIEIALEQLRTTLTAAMPAQPSPARTVDRMGRDARTIAVDCSTTFRKAPDSKLVVEGYPTLTTAGKQQ